MSDERRSPSDSGQLGDAFTAEVIAGDPATAFATVRATDPVAWSPELDAWVVTGYAEAVAVMRDADRFTVDDPRFTTGRVLGPSMLSLDGAEHRAHRTPFLGPFARAPVRDHQPWLAAEAARLIADFEPAGTAELRTQLAGPLATNTIIEVLGLPADPAVVMDWYRHIAAGVVALTDRQPLPAQTASAVADLLAIVTAEIRPRGQVPRRPLPSIAANSSLTPEDLAPSVAVVLFGAIETSEAMTSNLAWHLLTNTDQLELVAMDRSLAMAAIEESLRLEPAAALIDRYATTDVAICEGSNGPVQIRTGDQVMVSLSAANRDPSMFPDPDRFDIGRANSNRQLAFVQGPHACLGAHLARAETAAALTALLDLLPGLTLDHDRSDAPAGRVFRKPDRVTAIWR